MRVAQAAPSSWRIPLAFGGLALCVFYLLFSSWRAYAQVLDAQRARLHGEQVLRALNQLGREVVPDGSRALCAATGSPIESAAPSTGDWRNSIAQLRTLLADNPVQYERLGALRTALLEWQEIYILPVERACSEGQRLGAPYVQTLARVAQPTRQRIAALIEQLAATETALIAQREQHAQEVRGGAGTQFALATIASVVLGVVAVLAVRGFTTRLADSNRRLRREATERGVAQEQLQDSQRRLRMVLEHIPDAVIAFDAAGRIQWLNPAGELMFGRSRQSASGQPIALLIPALADELDWPVTQPQAELEGSSPLPWTARRDTLEGVKPGGAEFPIETALVQTRVEGDRIGVCVCRDLTEVQRVERMKHEFVSMVSHELRTPLTSIRGSLSMLADGTAGELQPAVQRLVNLAHDNSERLVALVNDILDFEKLRAGEVRMQIEPLDLVDCVQAAAEACEGYAETHRVKLLPQRSAEAVPVLGDMQRIGQVLANLLSNAVKFSPAEGAVQVVAGVHDGEGRVWVIDAGPGVPPAFVDRLFEPFAQAEGLNARKRGGTGLGLAISRAMMEQMGGRIGLEPQRPGQGAAFWIALPLRPTAMDPARSRPMPLG